MVFCTYCGRSFARNEHLERHVLTHTKVRPYKCVICHSSFTRAELVQKHYHSHTEKELHPVRHLISPSILERDRDGIPLSRQRLVVACTNCAKSKMRCDHKQPCGRCAARGLVCETPVRKRMRASASNSSPPQPTSTHAQKSPTGRQVSENANDTARQDSNPDRQPQADNIAESNNPFDTTSTELSNRGVENGDSSSTDPAAGNSTAQEPMEIETSPGTTSPVNENVEQNQITTMEGTPAATMDPAPFPDFPAVQTSTSPVGNSWNWMVPPCSNPLASPQVPNLGGMDTLSEYNRQSMQGSMFGGSTGDNGALGLLLNGTLPDRREDEAASEVNLFALNLNFMSFEEDVNDMTNAFQSSDSAPQNPAPGVEQWMLGKCVPYNQTVATPSDVSDIFDLDSSYTDPGSWSNSADQFRLQTFQQFEQISHAILNETTREWMLVVIQSFLRISLEVHGLKLKAQYSRNAMDPGKRPPDFFMFLPPNNSLHRYLEIFLITYDPFYPMIPALSLNPNKLATNSNERGATLLLLLMVALGSMLDPSPKARRFSFALFEICRHALADILAEDNTAYKSSLNLQCAFLFAIGGAFSGRRTHMDLAVGQKNLCLTVMRQNNFFNSLSSIPNQLSSSGRDVEALWRAWVDRETAVRLAYCWIIADQEISLFYDAPPCLTLSDLDIALPSDEKLWLAPSAAKWKETVEGLRPNSGETVYSFFDRPQLTLRELLVRVSDGRGLPSGTRLHPSHLRLLLYPLQLLVTQLRQFWTAFGPSTGHSSFSLPLLQTSSSLRAEELDRLLDRWMDLAKNVRVEGTRSLALMQSTTILYHLLRLNLLTSFLDLEAVARGEGRTSDSSAFPMPCDIALRDPHAVMFHCGQIFRLITSIDKKLRPNWWSAAMYRAAIIMWTLGISGRAGFDLEASGVPVRNIVLNEAGYRDRTLDFLRTRTGRPYLKRRNGSLVPLSDPAAVLETCMEALEPGPKMCRFTEGFLRRLEAVTKAWDGLHQSFKSISA